MSSGAYLLVTVSIEDDLHDPRRLTRMRAIRALGKAGGDGAVRLLIAKHDEEGESPVIRNLAMDALLEIGTPEVADLLEARLDTYPSARGRRIVAKKIAKLRRASRDDLR
ncbi:MAG: hypothetical protein QOF76_1884 [Solirubrobacteraceae bacterium]|jgi:HEAT repeat protein|nr:hypothetical protein [Solirubrobacteraceae bacterium]